MTTATRPALTEAQLDAALKALASAQRREILRILAASTDVPGKTCCAQDEMCGCTLAERLGLAASTISHHMSVLRAAGLITSRKDGTWVYYTARTDVLSSVAEAVQVL
ncbi:MAG: metalloregulator ArsR/SmtB family transcription factor [Coriobacteriia bacterium]|nr:metalloregulator ArsR/SmtB family transcription factor [Coriobacteriia bacterium]